MRDDKTAVERLPLGNHAGAPSRFERYLACGTLAHGFARVRCTPLHHAPHAGGPRRTCWTACCPTSPCASGSSPCPEQAAGERDGGEARERSVRRGNDAGGGAPSRRVAKREVTLGSPFGLRGVRFACVVPPR